MEGRNSDRSTTGCVARRSTLSSWIRYEVRRRHFLIACAHACCLDVTSTRSRSKGPTSEPLGRLDAIGASPTLVSASYADEPERALVRAELASRRARRHNTRRARFDAHSARSWKAQSCNSSKRTEVLNLRPVYGAHLSLRIRCRVFQCHAETYEERIATHTGSRGAIIVLASRATGPTLGISQQQRVADRAARRTASTGR